MTIVTFVINPITIEEKWKLIKTMKENERKYADEFDITMAIDDPYIETLEEWIPY
jgi:chitinase